MLTGLNHLTLAVSDIGRSWAFYTELLGFVPKAKWNTGAYLSLGELWLCLSLDTVGTKNDYTHYAFTVSPEVFAPLVEQLRLKKVAEWKINQSEGDSLYFCDPDGHKLEIHSGNLESRLEYCRRHPYAGMEFY
ncbi:fosfomycin resistance glutathione transferase [Tatumella ptyseos]|uniref:fosfomycin resistance glutathione transferase n=1 Tax=Tatumella ptyseos TaxID=82987 RepID=UPI0026EC421D|nr:fosfomycin resistance glutathione transferase [Tatumella ptyseos]WKX25430.1 fosfomycin resistance glutathione transferase [Tatumella ptyseos]